MVLGVHVQVLPAWINKIVSIEILRLAHNKIKKLPPLWGPFSQHLLELDLGYNLLSSIPQQFTWMTALKILDLSGNEIVSIPKSFGDCTALEELHVNFCALEVIDVHLAKCVKLTKFTYEGNEEMRYPPREVQMKGAEAMLKYFRQIIECPRTNIMLLDKFDLEEFDDKILDYPNVTWLNLSDNAITSVMSCSPVTTLKRFFEQPLTAFWSSSDPVGSATATKRGAGQHE